MTLSPDSCQCDLKNDIATQRAQMDRFCKEHGFVAWFDTSAKEGTNVEVAADCLVDEILKNDTQAVAKPDHGGVSLAAPAAKTEKSGGCCS